MALPTLAATGVKGTIVDSRTGQPVADANILLRGQSVFVVSGADGQFTISNAEPGATQLEVIAYGFEDAVVDVDIVAGIVRELGKVELRPEFNAMNLQPDDLNSDDDILADDDTAASIIVDIILIA